MNESHGHDPILACLEDPQAPLVRDVAGLDVEKPVDDLHVVLHPVVDFLQEQLFFLERAPDELLHLFALRDVYGEFEDLRHLPVFTEHRIRMDLEDPGAPVGC